MHFYGHSKGLKTGMYYLRSQAAVDAIKFTVDQKMLEDSQNVENMAKKAQEAMSASLNDKEDCVMCGS